MSKSTTNARARARLCACPYCVMDRAIGVAHAMCPYQLRAEVRQGHGGYLAVCHLNDGGPPLVVGPLPTHASAVAIAEQMRAEGMEFALAFGMAKLAGMGGASARRGESS